MILRWCSRAECILYFIVIDEFIFVHCWHEANIFVVLALNTQGSIPNEIVLLSNLTYLRLSYNAFTGAAPKGLGEIENLELLQLQSNRITEIPNTTRLDNSFYNESSFVTDCGVPSAFEEALQCDNCTMCCKYSCVCSILIRIRFTITMPSPRFIDIETTYQVTQMKTVIPK